MSYILDALNKAEADRDPQARANCAVAQRESHRQRLMIYALLAALLTNAVVLVWLFFPEPTGSEPIEPPPAATAPSQSTARQPAPAPQITAPERSASPIAPPGPAAEPDLEPPAEPRFQRTTLAGVSPAARIRFPELTFSTHVYADDPTLRAIVVNGTRLVEGDRLEGLIVHEITEEGAVFAFESYLVTIPVLEEWN